VNYNNPGVSFSPDASGRNNSVNFGRITSALDARRVQVGLRVTF
jgi:hypothetical protein